MNLGYFAGLLWLIVVVGLLIFINGDKLKRRRKS